MDISIVIVTYNTRELLRNCLRSIFNNTTGVEYEVIVVDNNSTDGTAEMVEQEMPSVKLIRNNKNVGFSKGNNQGFGVSSGSYIAALNSDTVVLDNAIAVTKRFMDKHPEAGAAGCRIVGSDGELQSSYERFPTILTELVRTTRLSRVFPHSVAKDRGGYLEVDWVEGSFLMLRRAAIEEVGTFDEIYSPAYSEEMDLCYRMKKAGWQVYYVPETSIVHYGGQTTRLKYTWHFLQLHRSKFIFFQRHRGGLYAHTYRLLRSVTCLIRISTILAKLPLFTRERNRLRSRLKLQWRLFRFLSDPHLVLPDLR